MAGSVGAVRPFGERDRRRAHQLMLGAAALAVVVATLIVIIVRPVPIELSRLAMAVGVFAAVHLMRLRVPVTAGDRSRAALLTGWGEIGLGVALCLVPPIWIPVTATVGGAIGLTLRSLRSGPHSLRALWTGSARSVAVIAVASGVVLAGYGIGGDPYRPLPARLVEPLSLLPMVLAGSAYLAVVAGCLAEWVAITTGHSRVEVVRSYLAAKHMMLFGRVTVGLGAVAAIEADPRWLVALIPVLWALHRLYDQKVRTDHVRRAWVLIADATRDLQAAARGADADDDAVARAAVRGAVALFAPATAELTLSTLTLAETAGGPRTLRWGSVPGPAYRASRRLAVGEVELGELALEFTGAAELAGWEEDALRSYADAVAVALHDAVTHRALRALTERGAFEAVRDPLTGVANRSTLIARGNALLRSMPPGTRVALIVVAVDGLREINDTAGYATGDQVLRTLAPRLEEADPEAMVGRLGGSDFAVLTVDIGPTSRSASDRARDLLAALAMPVRVSAPAVGSAEASASAEGGVASMSLSVEALGGVVEARAGNVDLAELLRRADVALDQAKREGSRLVVYDESRDAGSADRVELLADLRDALATTEQLVIDLQPVVDLRTAAVVGAEALVRWRHPRRGLLQPDEFIGVVENSELAEAFTLYVVDLALRVVARLPEVSVSVNLCARSILDPALPQVVAARLAAHAVPPRRLILEVTESVLSAESEQAVAVLTALRALGVRLWVDDFGTGPASFHFLTHCPVDALKIDRIFVAAMRDSPRTAAIVGTTVELARLMGLDVIAEGVEAEEQRDALTALGVATAQGFLFHRPMPVEEATPVLAGHH